MQRILQEDEQLFFLHVPKTAGTSLIAVLDQRYTVDEICPLDRGTVAEYLSLPEKERQRYKFIRGHFPYPLISHLRKPRTITFLRDPIKRTLSAIHHHKRLEKQGKSYFPDIHLASLTVQQFLDHPLLGSVVCNDGVKYLLGKRQFLTLSPATRLSLAKEHLDAFDFIGITECFHDSLELLAYTFGLFPIQDYPVLQAAPREEKSEEVLPQVLERLAEANRAEIELYEYGKKLFQQRWEQMKMAIAAGEGHSPIQPSSHLFYDFRRVNPGHGWYVGEIHPFYGVVRWSGPSTTSFLELPVVSERNLVIRFRVVGAIHPTVLNSLRLVVNEQEIRLKMRPDGESGAFLFEGQIPAALIKKQPGFLSLAFKISGTYQPENGGMAGTEVRKLGLCYNWLHIYPE